MPMNHHPIQQGEWIPYANCRYKDYYDVKLHSGEIFRYCYPNGNGWYPMGTDNPERRQDIRDSDVAEIRLVPDEELHEYAFKGRARIVRNLRMYEGYNMDWPEGYPKLEDLPEDEEKEDTSYRAERAKRRLAEPIKEVPKRVVKEKVANVEIMSAAEEKRKRRQERNLKNYKKGGVA